MIITKNTTLTGVSVCGPSMATLLRYGACFAPDDGLGGGGTSEEPLRDDHADPGPLNESDAEDAFLTNITGAEKATQESDDGEETGEEGRENDDAEADGSAEQQREEPAPKPSKNDADDAIVEVKVGEETHKVPVKDLKRLFGQEAALTRRSQDVAAEHAAVRVDAERAKTVLNKALERAEAKAAPYAEMDFLVLSRKLDEDTLTQLRKDAQDAFGEVSFLREEAQAADATIKRSEQSRVQAASQSCVKELTDPKSAHFVEGWSPKLYGDLMEFANAQGFASAKNITDPAAIRLLRSAMLYEKGKTLVREKVKTTSAQPTTPMRPGSAGAASPAKRANDAAFTRLQKSGSAEDAERAFMSRLRPRDDD